MPKPPSLSLFKLIKSLTKSEKRQIRLMAMRYATGTSGKTMQLYDLICKANDYDESKIKTKIYGESGKINAFAVLKRSLFELVLDGLLSLRSKDTVSFQLDNIMPRIQILYKKRMYEECWTLLKKAKKLAQKGELYIRLLDILRWEKKLVYTTLDMKYLNNNLDSRYRTEQETLEYIDDQLLHWNQYFKMMQNVLKIGVKRTTSEEINWAKAGKTNEAKVLHLKMQSLNCYSKGDYPGFLNHNMHILELLSPEYIIEEPLLYISTLNNSFIGSALLGKYNEADKRLEKVKTAIDELVPDDNVIKLEYYNSKLALLSETGRFGEGVSFVKKIQSYINIHKGDVPPGLNYHIAYLYFGVGMYSESTDYLNTFLEISNKDIRQDIQCATRIFKLILHFELGDWLYLESLLVSTYRYFLKREKLFGIEKMIIKLIRRSGSVKNKNDMLKIIVDSEEKLNELLKDPKEKLILDYFNFMAWIKSKRLGQSFEEVARKAH